MKKVILGAGKMGSFFADVLSFDHEIALYDIDPHRLRFAFNTLRMTRPEEIRFYARLSHQCGNRKIYDRSVSNRSPLFTGSHNLSDIASVKTGLPEFYAQARHSIRIDTPYVRTDIR